ncbi:Ppx/GppA family phosphatase [Enterococcus italicus]|uniref:Ppx/GppA family phosphatase n=1 Tax=Enterococcus italicus TaxID=246144 RepID=UPI0020734DF4|nr:Ppx/GppA family phosphatase [Enterococcus italicus]
MGKTKKVAIIDVGSNTVRLVIYQVSPVGNISQLQNVKLPARLYQYLDENQELSESGTAKLVEVIQLFQEILSEFDVDEIIATATAVIRQATNRQAVLAKVAEQTKLNLRLLSGEEEAYYGQYAVVRTTQFSEGYTVDMGGGSTEVTYFKDNQIQHSHSFPFGVVTLKNLFFQNKEPNDSKAIKKTKDYVRKQFASQKWIKPRDVPIIGIGGSARNIASVYQIVSNYPLSGIHEYEMTKANLNETSELFQSLTLAELQNLDGLSKDRADIILPANLTFLALCEITEAEKFVFCNKGLREGLLLKELSNTAEQVYDPDRVVEGVLMRMTESYGIDVALAQKRRALAEKLLTLCQEEGLVTLDPKLLQYVYYAAFLYHIGSYIEEDDSSMHSFYLLANSNLNGFTHKERVALALLASYKNKSLTRKFLQNVPDWFSSQELSLIRQAGSLIKFTESLLITRVNEICSISLTKDKKCYVLAIDWSKEPLAESYRANRQKKNFEAVINKSVKLEFTRSEKKE